MPYEYQVFYYVGPDPNMPTGMITDEDLVRWLNELGRQDWRLVELMDYFSGQARGLFERKIAISEKLRAIQLGKENETDDNGSERTDQD